MNIKDIDNKNRDYFLLGSVLILFILVTTYKLTNASLWFDETVEYWYSKVLVGTLPYDSTKVNMYQRITSTYQPPLYNILMYFWLRISDSVWWFRFFGVVMGFIGMIGLYKGVCKAIDNSALASASVAFSAFVYQLLYYWQECAEYCLMLAALFWTVYYWICVIKAPSRKSIIGFTITAVISVYSQYGAAFPVAVMAIMALIIVISGKDKKHIADISISYIAAAVLAALPLYVFFLRKQMNSQSGSRVAISEITFEGNIIFDQIKALTRVFKWNLFSYYSTAATLIIFILLAIALIVVLFKGRKYARTLIITNAIIWELYYISVKLGIYSYGNFANRYNLFFIPIWVVTFFVVIFELYHIISGSARLNKTGVLQYMYAGAIAAFCLCFCIFAWTARIQNNWGKEEARNATAEWVKQKGYDSDTLVYYGANSGFAYYIRSDEGFDGYWEDNVTYMPWFSSRSEEDWNKYLNDIYGTDWPDQLYVVATHVAGNDLNLLSDQFIDKGYEKTNLYTSGGYLIRFSK